MKRKNIFGGIIFGGILLLSAIVGLWWNEGNYVKEDKKIAEGKAIVLPKVITSVDSQNEGKLVFVQGTVTSENVLEDKNFGINKKLIKLKRKTETFQYKEVKKNRGNDIEYEEVWEENLISSKDFVNEVKKNPQISRFPSQKWKADQVKLSDFELNSTLINQINAWESLPLDDGQLIVAQDTFLVRNNIIYQSKSPEYPAIGDTRTTFSVVYPNKEVSLVAQQRGNSFAPYHTENGRTIELLKMGTYTAEQFFQSMEKSNSTMNWFFRIFGFFGLFFGFKLILNPLVAVGKIIPFLGRLVGVGTSLIAGALAGIFGFIVVGLSWLFYRPLIGILLLAVAAGLIYWIKQRKKINRVESIP